ncbi:glycosyltransferase family 25 protein [Aestuariivirga sp.]|uniref:glycosyltransferase family 25 protein n=1 Tax=Aestuariivirga sp. TaxID=2650926 RepID=UPI0039E594B5
MAQQQQKAGPVVAAVLRQFPFIRIISLTARTDRRARVNRQFAALGIDMEARGLRYFDAIRFEDAGDFPTLGARGCFESHLLVLEDCARQNRLALVLEDDIKFEMERWAALPDLPALIKSGPWDMLYFGYGNPIPPAGQPLRPWDGPVMTTHAYAVTPAAARRIVDYLQACKHRQPGDPVGGPMHVDGAFTMFRQQNPDFRTLVAAPQLITQFSSRSDLGTEKWWDRSRLLQPFIERLRRARSGV